MWTENSIHAFVRHFAGTSNKVVHKTLIIARTSKKRTGRHDIEYLILNTNRLNLKLPQKILRLILIHPQQHHTFTTKLLPEQEDEDQGRSSASCM